MSIPGSQSAASPVLSAPIVSDLPAPQPGPVGSPGPAPVNGIGAAPVTSGAEASAHSGPTKPAPASSAPTLPSQGPPPSAPSQPTQPAYPGNPPSSSTTPIGRGAAAPPQYRGRPLPSTYPAQPAYLPYSSSQPAQASYQRLPVQQQAYQSQSARPMIIDPPRKRSSMGMAVEMPSVHKANFGFPSPTSDYPSVFPKFSDDMSRIVLAIKQSVPEAVRQAVRDNWEKCLLGSDFHQAFVLNASIHHSPPGVQARAIHDFGARLVANCKAQLIEHLSSRDLDDLADQIIAKASNAFLDKALETRLTTIDAKPLLQALARAERLGYDSQDLVDVSHGEHVIPSGSASQPQNSGAAVTASLPAVNNKGNRAAHPGELQCIKCYRTFAKKAYFDYHVARNVCLKIPPTEEGFRYSCQRCGKGFTNQGGLTYHNIHLVCEVGAGSAEVDNSPLPSGSVPSNGSPGYSNLAPTPAARSAKSISANIPPGNYTEVLTLKGSSPSADPYGHLNVEQMAALNQELHEAEEQYAGRFRDAEAIPDPEQRRLRIESLRNTFGTKQSMIRKKYGVRLRERRTRAEIQAERERMGLPSLKGGPSNESPASTQRPRTSMWTAANQVTSVDLTDDSTPSHKRRRVDENNGYATTYPRQNGGETTKVSEMAGGLGASSAMAAHQDPTIPPSRPSGSSTPSRRYQQSGARVEVYLPSRRSSSAVVSPSKGGPNGRGSREPGSLTPGAMDVDGLPAPQGPSEDPGSDAEEVDNESESEVVKIDNDSDSDSDGAEDIPAKLPANVRQSLTSSRPGSSQ